MNRFKHRPVRTCRPMLWVLGLWPMIVAAEDRALSLEEAVDRALQQAPRVAASAAGLDAAVARAPSAGRLPDPELVGGVDNLPVDTAERFSFTRDFMTMRKIGLIQSLPSGEKRRLRSERADREIAVAHGEVLKTRYEVARAAADAWIARAVDEESLARLKGLEPDVAVQAAAGRAALASGRGSAAEALGGQSLVAALDERILALEQDRQMQRAELTRWIGVDADRPPARIPTDAELNVTPEALIDSVPHHPPLAPVVARLAQAQTDVDLARADKRPDWSVEADYAQRGPAYSNMVSLEFHVSLPLFGEHRQNPVIAEKLARVRAQEAERDDQVRMHTAEIQGELIQWRLGRERLKHYLAELLPLARDRSRAAVASYSAGRSDLRGAVDALTQEIDTQLAYVQLEGQVARAWTYLHFLHDSGVSP